MNAAFCNFNDARGMCNTITVMPTRQAFFAQVSRTSAGPSVKGSSGQLGCRAFDAKCEAFRENDNDYR